MSTAAWSNTLLIAALDEANGIIEHKAQAGDVLAREAPQDRRHRGVLAAASFDNKRHQPSAG